MFYLDSANIYHAAAFDRFDWLVHGFGTRHAPDPASFPALATVRQIHSDICIAAHGRTGVLGEGDCLIDNTPGSILAVKTADCVPVLLVDEEHRAVAAVHAGWRGTARGIVRAAIGRMREEFGTEARFVHAAIGPSIGKCCYEVGAEVAAQFGIDGPAHLDLVEANRAQLAAAGVPEAQIHAAGLCTKCGAADFHSYRRDQDRSGRMLTFIGIR